MAASDDRKTSSSAAPSAPLRGPARSPLRPRHGLRALASTWRGRFIIAFLAVQLLLPLQYYLTRKDPHDERFAWRMFSPMRMSRCTPSVTIDGRHFSLGIEFHEAWVEIANRGRYVVVEAMAARLCAKHPGSKVELSLACTYLDRESARIGGWDMCKVTEL